MMRIRSFFMFLFIIGAVSVNAQYTKEFKRIFFDADYLFETQFYEEAFNRYKNLLTLDPGNSNILFLCGACCLSIPGSENLAITYLQEAVEGVSMSYKEHSHKESGAPVFSYFMLGQAYHLNYDFEKAVENYERYLELGSNQDPLQLEFARLQIEACGRGAELVLNRPSHEFHSVLDQFDDDLPSCSNPVISGDGNILIFLVDYPSDKKIMMTTRTDKLWTRPRVINSEIGMVGETYPVCLSYDGKDLYMMHQYYSHSDIFVSSNEGGRWSPAKALGQNINGRTSETHASVSKDGKSLYFTSDARGGFGSFDIYVSRLDDKGQWGVPTNLGPSINTPYEEHTPFISSNDSILFFSSQGHASIGGTDVFYAELNADGSWGEPINLGYPVNTTGEDLFFNPGWDKLEGYYAVRREDDPTSNTINMVLELEPEEQTAEIKPETIPVEKVKVVSEPQVSTITEVIEPVETDRIEEVLNRNNREVIEAPNELPIESTIEPPIVPSKIPSELSTSIRFGSNSFSLNLDAMLEVEKLAVLMVYNPDSRVSLIGHTDETGLAEHNILLSMQRADQVAEYLEMRGVHRGRITVDGKGESAPVAINSFPDGEDAPLGRYLNRQVFVTVTGLTILTGDFETPDVPKSLKYEMEKGAGQSNNYFWFTIQLKASFVPIDLSQFNVQGELSEFICTDNYYRYTHGAYKTFQEARDELRKIHQMGFEDAFIQTLEWYERASK